MDFWQKIKPYYKNGRYYYPDKHFNQFLKAGHQLYPLAKKWTRYRKAEIEKIIKIPFIIKDYAEEKKDLPETHPVYQLQKK